MNKTPYEWGQRTAELEMQAGKLAPRENLWDGYDLDETVLRITGLKDGDDKFEAAEEYEVGYYDYWDEFGE